MMIKILRLKNGDDIICNLEKEDNDYHIDNPMLIWLEEGNKVPKLCMDHWLPLQVVKDNCTTLKSEDILAEFSPNDQLEEYYVNTITELNSVLLAKEMADEMTDNELIESILAMQEGSGSTFH